VEKSLKHIPQTTRCISAGHADSHAISRSTDVGLAGNTVHVLPVGLPVWDSTTWETQEGWIKFYTSHHRHHFHALLCGPFTTMSFRRTLSLFERGSRLQWGPDPSLSFHAPLDEARGHKHARSGQRRYGTFRCSPGMPLCLSLERLGTLHILNGDGRECSRFPYYPQLNFAYELFLVDWAKIPTAGR